MTKEELEKEADDYAEKHAFRVPYDGSNKFYDDVDFKASKEAYVAGAELREKRIADLERKLEQTEKDLAISEHDREHNDYELTEVYKKVEQLEKENAELKKHIEMDCIDCVDYIKNRKLEKQLEQAKELLRRSYDNYISMQPLRGEIEKFLKE